MGQPINRPNNRFLAPPSTQPRESTRGHLPPDIGLSGESGGVMFIPFLEVCAGAERASRARDDAAAEEGFSVVPGQDGVQVVVG